MRKVLILTYYWPPGSGPGVQRTLKFCKYFKQFGWEPIVITVKNGSYASVDSSLEKDIPSDLRVYKTKTFELFELYNILRGKKGKSLPVAHGTEKNKSFFKKLIVYLRANFFIPDARKYWSYFAYNQAKKIIINEKISAVYTTGPPHSTHLIGKKIKENFQIPHLVDMRDPWTNIYYNTVFPRSKKTIKADKLLEKNTLEQADAVTVVSSGLLNEFSDINKNIHLIYNGFDLEDIPKATAVKTNKFILSYIGNLKPNQNIEALWQAIGELCDENEWFKNNFELNLTGNISNDIDEYLTTFLPKGIYVKNPFVEHKQALKLMQTTNLLLFIIPNVRDNDKIITGKLFEYLAIGTEMLSIGPINGDATKILSTCNRKSMIDYSDKEAIKFQLKNNFDEWFINKKTSIKYALTKEVLSYSREKQTEQMANVLNTITK